MNVCVLSVFVVVLGVYVEHTDGQTLGKPVIEGLLEGEVKTVVDLYCMADEVPEGVTVLYQLYKESDGRRIGEYMALYGGPGHFPVYVRATYDGRLICKASAQNNTEVKPSYSDPVHFRVLEKVEGAHITSDPPSEEFWEGDSVTLRCSVTAGTYVSYEWLLNDRPVQLDYNRSQNHLTIQSLSASSNGTYGCVASNQFNGTLLSSSAYTGKAVRVKAGCLTSLSISHDSLLVEYGDPVELSCSIPTKPSQYQLGWETSVNPINPTDSETSVVWRSPNLTDWEVNRHRMFCYLSESPKPPCKKEVHLSLYKRPDSVKISSESDVRSEDQKMTLKCEVQNVGPLQNLTVRWIRTDQNKNTEPVNKTSYGSFSSSGKQDESGNVTATLEVTASRDEDGVQYQCVALLNLDLQHPQVGQSELHTISVHYKPTIVQPYTDTISVTKGDSLTLNCSAHGNPSPQYVWSSPGNQILTRSSIFTIDSVQSGDQYSCTASNTEGSDSVTVRVNVVENYWLIIIICVVVAVAVLLVTGLYILRKQRQRGPP